MSQPAIVPRKDPCGSTCRSGLAALAPLVVLAMVISAALPVSAEILRATGVRPLFFESSQGLGECFAPFLSRTANGTFYLTATGAVAVLSKVPAVAPMRRDQIAEEIRHRHIESRAVSFEFVGANTGAQVTGNRPLPAKVNYLLGADAAHWRTEIPTFSAVRVHDLYPGVEVVYYGSQESLEYDLVVEPGADPSLIDIRVRGADRLELDEKGDLVIVLGGDRVRQHKPISYQLIAGVRQPVEGHYRLKNADTVTFELGAYDRDEALVIDPVLIYSTYFGGAGFDAGYDVALDAAGNVYVAGETLSPQLPVPPGAFQTNYAGGYPNAGGDAFIAKFDPTGTNLVYLTYLGGNGDDAALGVVVGALGEAYLTGVTDSTNFPVKQAIEPTIHGTGSFLFGLHPWDAFVAKLNPTGSGLIFSTYLGGDTQDQGIGIAIDAFGDAYITGLTDSTNFPAVQALQPVLAGAQDAFITKIKSDGSALVYSTYLGGTNVDGGDGIAVDGGGRAVVAGVTSSTDFPTFNAFQPGLAGGFDVFLTVLGPSGTNVFASTFFGGLLDDEGFRVRLDSAGNALITGSQSSSSFSSGNFPITPGPLSPGGVFQRSSNGATWTFSGSGLLQTMVNALAIDPLSPLRMYAGTAHGLARSTDGGLTWRQPIGVPTFSGFASGLSVGSVRALAVDPLTPSTVYAGTDDGLYKSIDFGLTWTLNATGLVYSANGLLVSALAINPLNPSILYLASASGVFESTNSAGSWFSSTFGLEGLIVNDLAIDTVATNLLYAATSQGGVYRSSDSGASWTPFNSGITNPSAFHLAVDPQTPSTVFVGTTGGLYKTTNRGTNWNVLNFGPTYSNLPPTALALAPSAPSRVYVGTYVGVLSSIDGGLTWTFGNAGLALPWVASLAVHPIDPQHLYAGTTGIGLLGSTYAFLAKFNLNNGALVFSKIFGGSATTIGEALAVDSAGYSYVAGLTSSVDFPTKGTSGFLSSTNHGGRDAFVTSFNPDASDVQYSVLVGGTFDDYAFGLAADSAGNAFITGQTSSPDFPIVNAFQPSFGGGRSDAFLAKINVQPTLAAAVVGGNLQLTWRAFSPPYILETTPTLLPTQAWLPVGQAPTYSNGLYTLTLPAAGSGSFFRLRLP